MTIVARSLFVVAVACVLAVGVERLAVAEDAAAPAAAPAAPGPAVAPADTTGGGCPKSPGGACCGCQEKPKAQQVPDAAHAGGGCPCQRAREAAKKGS